MKVKICGITNLKDALLAESLGADAIGFIFYKNSKRFISPFAAEEISKQLSPFTIKVGVFVNQSKEEIESITSKVRLNIIQLHGDESVEFCNSFNLPVIKAFRIKDNFDFSQIFNYKNTSILLDAFDENNFGGTGLPFKWDSIPSELNNKIILAGGISTENLEIIFSKIKPVAIDLVSSLEKSPGIKDENKMKKFFIKHNELRKI